MNMTGLAADGTFLKVRSGTFGFKTSESELPPVLSDASWYVTRRLVLSRGYGLSYVDARGPEYKA
jgi:hypothetical protein